MMLNDKEQRDLLRWQDEQRHDMTTTEKINKKLSESEQRILQQVAEVWSQVFEDQAKIQEHDGFISKIKRAFGGVVRN